MVQSYFKTSFKNVTVFLKHRSSLWKGLQKFCEPFNPQKQANLTGVVYMEGKRIILLW